MALESLSQPVVRTRYLDGAVRYNVFLDVSIMGDLEALPGRMRIPLF